MKIRIRIRITKLTIKTYLQLIWLKKKKKIFISFPSKLLFISIFKKKKSFQLKKKINLKQFISIKVEIKILKKILKYQ